jgi:hypothetical protein
MKLARKNKVGRALLREVCSLSHPQVSAITAAAAAETRGLHP